MAIERIDSSTEQSSGWGGKRPGAGRRVGSKNKRTLEQEKVQKAFNQRVMRFADQLFNAQMDLATGEKYLMVKRTEGKRVWHEIVDDPDTVIQYLDGNLDDTNTEYYYMTTKPANNMAIDSLLDRTFGKAMQSINQKNSGEQKLTVEITKYADEDTTTPSVPAP